MRREEFGSSFLETAVSAVSQPPLADGAIFLPKVSMARHFDKQACLHNADDGSELALEELWLGNLAKVSVDNKASIVCHYWPSFCNCHSESGFCAELFEPFRNHCPRHGDHLNRDALFPIFTQRSRIFSKVRDDNKFGRRRRNNFLLSKAPATAFDTIQLSICGTN